MGAEDLVRILVKEQSSILENECRAIVFDIVNLLISSVNILYLLTSLTLAANITFPTRMCFFSGSVV